MERVPESVASFASGSITDEKEEDVTGMSNWPSDDVSVTDSESKAVEKMKQLNRSFKVQFTCLPGEGIDLDQSPTDNPRVRTMLAKKTETVGEVRVSDRTACVGERIPNMLMMEIVFYPVRNESQRPWASVS